MEVKEFRQVFSNYVWIDVQELFESFLNDFVFQIVKYLANQTWWLSIKLNKVFHRSILFLCQLFVVKHLVPELVHNLRPIFLDLNQLWVDFFHQRHKSLKLEDAMLANHLGNLF